LYDSIRIKEALEKIPSSSCIVMESAKKSSLSSDDLSLISSNFNLIKSASFLDGEKYTTFTKTPNSCLSIVLQELLEMEVFGTNHRMSPGLILRKSENLLPIVFLLNYKKYFTPQYPKKQGC
jgi:hypothetical protein